MKQKLLWVPPAIDCGAFVKRAPRIPFTDPEPHRVWTLFMEKDESKPPKLPITPVHRVNAFMEDYVHDWNVFRGKFLYASRIEDGGVWLLLEYKD